MTPRAGAQHLRVAVLPGEEETRFVLSAWETAPSRSVSRMCCWAAPAAAPAGAGSTQEWTCVPVPSRLGLQGHVREQTCLPAVQRLSAGTGHWRPEPEPQNALPGSCPRPCADRRLGSPARAVCASGDGLPDPLSALFRALSLHSISPGCGPDSDTRAPPPHREADSGVCGRSLPVGRASVRLCPPV